MARNFLLYELKDFLVLQYKFFCVTVFEKLSVMGCLLFLWLQWFVDEIFKFEFFVLHTNDVTFSIMTLIGYRET